MEAPRRLHHHPLEYDPEVLIKSTRKYNKRLVDIDAVSGDGVTATFDDGTQHTASLLIGADGAHSKVRRYLFGTEKGQELQSPYVLSVVISKLPIDQIEAFRKLTPRLCSLFHPNGTFTWIGGMC